MRTLLSVIVLLLTFYLGATSALLLPLDSDVFRVISAPAHYIDQTWVYPSHGESMIVEDVIVFAFKVLVLAVFFYIVFGMLGIIKVKDEPPTAIDELMGHGEGWSEDLPILPDSWQRANKEDDLDDGNPNRP